MARLHPDKIVGVARAVRARPRRPGNVPRPGGLAPAGKEPTPRPGPIAPAGKEPTPRPGPIAKAGKEPERVFLKDDPKGEEAGSLIEALAYRLRDSHQGSHLNRMARVGEASEAKKSKSSKKGKSKSLMPEGIELIPPAQANEAPIVMFNFGGRPPARRNG